MPLGTGGRGDQISIFMFALELAFQAFDLLLQIIYPRERFGLDTGETHIEHLHQRLGGQESDGLTLQLHFDRRTGERNNLVLDGTEWPHSDKRAPDACLVA